MSYRETQYETILHSYDGPVATIQMHRPQALNACNLTMHTERLDLLKHISQDPEIKVVILTGDEKAFCAGGDLVRMSTYNVVDANEHLYRILEFNRLMDSMRQVTIAAISGFCLGGGLEAALACDLRVACENATLGLPEINVGIFPGGGGTQRLVQSLPIGKAKEMIFLGGKISAQEAYDWGIVTKLLPTYEETMEAAKEWAAKLCKKPFFALSSVKKCINYAWGQPTVRGIEFEAATWNTLFGTEDQKEGMNAFANKRKPVYKGR